MTRYLKVIISTTIVSLLLLSIVGCSPTQNETESAHQETESSQADQGVETETQQPPIGEIEQHDTITLTLSYGERTGSYEGEMNNGLPHGVGKFTTENSSGVKWSYEGEWVMGHYEGWGTTVWETGAFEVGFYEQDVYNPQKTLEYMKNDSSDPMTDVEVDRMYTNTAEFAGRAIELSGRVFTSPDRYEGSVQFQIFADSANSDKNTMIRIFEPNIQIENDSYISVKGVVTGLNVGENMLGGTLYLPVIDVISYEIITQQQALYPTLYDFEVNQSISQLGYEIVVDRIEIGEGETRVYVTVHNNGAGKLRLYSHNCTIIQGSTQYDHQSNYRADYPQVSNDLFSGITSEGVLTFPQIEYDDFTIIWEGRSDNYREKLEPYRFDITVN